METSTKTRHLRHLLRVALGQTEIGQRIAVARDKAGLTQQELADRIGVKTAQSISRYERGETEVPMKKLERIADATRKPLSFFIQVPEERQAEAYAWDQVMARLDAIEAREGQTLEVVAEILRLVRGDSASEQRDPV